jgi:hypothetical protein
MVTLLQQKLVSSSSTLAFSFLSYSPSTSGAILPFALDCNGTLVSTRSVFFSQSTSYNVTIRIDNIGFGSTSNFLLQFCD